MRIAVTTDLHLTPLAKQQGNWSSESALLRYLELLEQKHHRIILGGDVFQTDYGPFFGSNPFAIEEVRTRYYSVFSKISKPTYVQLFGNHDRAAADYLGLPSVFEYSGARFDIIVGHGDNHDPSVAGWLPDLTMWTFGRLREAGLAIIVNPVERGLLAPIHQMLAHHTLRRAARSIAAARRRFTVVVFGHSHSPALEQISGGVYANPGACSESCPGFISIDTDEGSISLGFATETELRIIRQVKPTEQGMYDG